MARRPPEKAGPDRVIAVVADGCRRTESQAHGRSKRLGVMAPSTGLSSGAKDPEDEFGTAAKVVLRDDNGSDLFSFEPHSPTYLSAANSNLYSELPDSIKNELYNLYQVRLPLFELLYNEQRQNIAHFRNNTVVPAGDFYHDDVTDIHPDLKKLAQEIEHPVYGNFINQVILLEKEVYKLNESDFVSLIELEASLRSYIVALKGG